jgi:hypothetical protein
MGGSEIMDESFLKMAGLQLSLEAKGAGRQLAAF